MKKFILGAFISIIAVSNAFAATVTVNDEPIEQEPVITDGRTLVPVRGVFEKLGYNVEYDNATKTATLSNGTTTVTITAGNTYFTVNGEEITPDVPQQIIDGSFMLPLRAVGDSIGAEVNWDSTTKTASIKLEKHTGLILNDSINIIEF